MAVSSDLVRAYATQFLPSFRFADSERVFPVNVESWVTHCAEGDWDNETDPHRGSAVVEARVPLTMHTLFAQGGCRGVSASSGPVGAPLDPSQPLPDPGPSADELFIDFAGWPSLETNDGFTRGDDDYIRGYYGAYFEKFNSFLAQGPSRPPTRTKPTLPEKMTVYCEASWAGDFTRASIAGDCWDFATASTDDPSNPHPDPALDQFLVLTYYLFYPATEPPPPNASLSPGSPNLNYREGQWEAVSLYFNGAPDGHPVASADDLTLPGDPANTTPAYAVLSNGITVSGDGQSPQLVSNYPATVGSWPQGGQDVLEGGFPSEGKEFVPRSVFVTSGTHKNLFTSTPVTITSDPDQTALAAGAALEGAGGLVAGITGGTGVGLVFGFLLWLVGLIISVVAAGETSTTPAPDPAGDIVGDSGPASGSTGDVTPGNTGRFVPAELSTYSTLPGNEDLQTPPWWEFPGRWGIATSSELASWDGGGRHHDFKGRSRAYWNTVTLQANM